MTQGTFKNQFPGRNPTQDRLLTVREVADLLGVSVRLVNRFLATGKLDRVKLGRATRVRLTDVTQLMREGTA